MRMTNATLAAFLSVSFLAAGANAADKAIERRWKAKCASCHGVDGKGETETGKKMKVPDFTTAVVQSRTDDQIKKSINDGIKVEKDGVKKEMEPFKEVLKDGELDGLVKFIRGLAV